MEAKNTLNGFEAILDTLNPHVGTKTKTEDNDTDVIDAAAEELTDEELEKMMSSKMKIMKRKMKMLHLNLKKLLKLKRNPNLKIQKLMKMRMRVGNKNLIVIIPMVEMIQAMKK